MPTGPRALLARIDQANHLGGRVDTAQELPLIIREQVHRPQRDIEPARRDVDSEHADCRAIERQRPARSAVLGVKALHCERPSDVGEAGQRGEVREA